LSEAFHFPLGMSNVRSNDVPLSAAAQATSDGIVEITLHAERFAQSIALECGDFLPDDNYFHMAPATQRTIVARAADARATFRGMAQPLNSSDGIRIALAANADVPV
jgi:beta-mannosidase